LFHEIEWILYEEQPIGAVAIDETNMPDQFNLRMVMMNSVDSPLADRTIRKTLSYLIEREMYNELLGHSYAVSHMFEWTEFHDSTLPIIPYSIGKATSTLAKGGYRPQALH
jgi:ABC-type transport system substrate-binding protein